MRPWIGVTLDSEPAGGWSASAWYALRQNYCSAIAAAGGVPVCLPHECELVPSYIERLSGFVITGGAFDVDPKRFGANHVHPSVHTKARRTEFEWRLVEASLERELPLFGICGGEQLLNVVLGGTLIQHIPDEVPGALPHEQTNAHHQPSHRVSIEPGTRLFQLLGGSLEVNSTHHQAVDRLGRDLRVAARSSDGVIEAIEHTSPHFCLGVQWHPEYFFDPPNDHGRVLFRALVEACGA
ncbi:MAG: gamma-glutamyl-gamma-aminobutyrate hydrolase family protein [Polyangiaceae bacterium]